MSQVMKALESTQRATLNQSNSGMYPSPQGVRSTKKWSLTGIACVVLLPSIAVVGSQVLPDYVNNEPTPVPVVVEVEPIPVEAPAIEIKDLRPAPQLTELKPLLRQESYLTAQPMLRTVESNSSAPRPVEAPVPATEAANVQGQPTANENLALENLDMSEFSPELALTIESILNGTNDSNSADETTSSVYGDALDIEKDAAQLEGWLPKLNFQAHMYSSDENKRWIKVNGQEASSGDWVDEGIQIIDIEPQFVMIQFKRLNIRVPALYEWQG
ncbi:hypothetical protein EK599_15820 [Vibrio sp. T187]|uniref:general secretion pathway protein GspB n=1 Tax=Vibrio TaxID=662 RepID=UPI0010C959A3|nr:MULTISPECIES: general secretion pathway protein GspB [Vibrio]MBW3697167.1 hypothetical protein [Vibrio sp. T187]